MKLPSEIAALVEQAYLKLPTSNPARAHHAIPLLFTLGVMLALRTDGVILDLWPEQEPEWSASDGKARIVSPDEEWLGIVAGSEEYPWLADLIPSRPPDAKDCDKCGGKGRIPTRDWTHKTVTIFCSDCNALGWRSRGR